VEWGKGGTDAGTKGGGLRALLYFKRVICVRETERKRVLNRGTKGKRLQKLKQQDDERDLSEKGGPS